MPGRLLGPLHHLAPEIYSSAFTCDPAPADVHALGKTLWTLAAGQSFPPPGHLVRQVPQFTLGSYRNHPRIHLLERLLEQSTDPNPLARPTMEAFSAEVDAWHRGPSLSNTRIDLSDLQARLSPPIQRQIEAQRIRDDCTNHVEQIISKLIERLRPLAHDIQQVLQLPVDVGARHEASNIAEIQMQFSRADHPSYRSAACCVKSPMPMGKGKNPLELHSGVIILFTATGLLRINGAHALHRGSGIFSTIWVEMHEVQYSSAREESAIDSIMVGLNRSMPGALDEFVALLDAQTS